MCNRKGCFPRAPVQKETGLRIRDCGEEGSSLCVVSGGLGCLSGWKPKGRGQCECNVCCVREKKSCDLELASASGMSKGKERTIHSHYSRMANDGRMAKHLLVLLQQPSTPNETTLRPCL